MTVKPAPNSRGTQTGTRAAAAALLSILLASCTATTGEPIALGTPSFNQMGPTAALMAEVAAEESAADEAPAAEGAAATIETAMAASAPEAEAAGDGVEPALPAAVASLPSARPGAATGSDLEAAGAATEPAEAVSATTVTSASAPQAAPEKKGFLASLFGNSPAPEDASPAATAAATVSPPQVTADAQGDAAEPAADIDAGAAPPQDKPQPQDEATAATEAEPVATGQPATGEAGTAKADAAGDPAPTVVAEAAPATDAPKKKGFLSAFFGSTKEPAAATAVDRQAGADADAGQAAEPQAEVAGSAEEAAAEEPTAPKPLILRADEAKPIVTLASAGPSVKRTPNLASLGGDDNALPGVRQSALFEIKRKTGLDDDSDVDLYEGEDYGAVQVAAAAGMARLAPNGLLKQRESVDVACLKPSLVRMLKTVERRFGKRLIVTSGYRSPSYNRKVRGARRSMHMFCAAADVQVPGVSKWELAKFVRSLPGRGGVGTYCHTNSVHIDVGPERDWNWRCRRRRS